METIASVAIDDGLKLAAETVVAERAVVSLKMPRPCVAANSVLLAV